MHGIETNIVVHVYPENCPECGICFEDPVIISRSTAFLAMSKYRCAMPCFHCQQDEHQFQRNVSLLGYILINRQKKQLLLARGTYRSEQGTAFGVHISEYSKKNFRTRMIPVLKALPSLENPL